MKKHAHGFTLIEIAIFLAVTGALFVAITVGVQNSIYQQRYNDAVQSFAGFLGNLYSEVTNVQSTGNGRHDEAIYGKLVTFGESTASTNPNVQEINVYNVIASAVNSSNIGNEGSLATLKALGANVVRKNNEGKYDLVGIVESYSPKWSAKIQKTDAFDDYVGALLIVRDARSGIVRTFVLSGATIEVESVISSALGDAVNVFSYSEERNYLDDFAIEQADFCINPSGNEPNYSRMDVRIVAGAHDASGIEIISYDNEGNKCNE